MFISIFWYNKSMVERILKAFGLILVSIIYLPALLVVMLIGDTWKDLLTEFGL